MLFRSRQHRKSFLPIPALPLAPRARAAGHTRNHRSEQAQETSAGVTWLFASPRCVPVPHDASGRGPHHPVQYLLPWLWPQAPVPTPNLRGNDGYSTYREAFLHPSRAALAP